MQRKTVGISSKWRDVPASTPLSFSFHLYSFSSFGSVWWETSFSCIVLVWFLSLLPSSPPCFTREIRADQAVAGRLILAFNRQFRNLVCNFLSPFSYFPCICYLFFCFCFCFCWWKTMYELFLLSRRGIKRDSKMVNVLGSRIDTYSTYVFIYA